MSGCIVLKTSIICRPSVRCDQRRDSLFCTLWWLWEPAVGRVLVHARSRVCCGARLKSPRTRMRVLCFFSFCTSPISVSAHLVYSCAEASEDAGAVGALFTALHVAEKNDAQPRTTLGDTLRFTSTAGINLHFFQETGAIIKKELQYRSLAGVPTSNQLYRQPL